MDQSARETVLYSDLPSEPITLKLVEEEDIRALQDVLESWDPRSRRFVALESLRARQAIAFLVPLLESNTNPVPFRSLFRILCKRWQANLVLIESPYVEMEFWDTYASFHSRSFLPHPKVCWRLHFFKSTCSNNTHLIKDIHAGATQDGLATSGFEYLGFTTLRPTPSFNLGRTALKFDEKTGRERGLAAVDEIELDGKRFCKGKAVQVANVCATKLEVDAVPYLQQDPVAGMCATASLWVASQVLAAKFELHKFPYIQITRQAEVSSGRVLPSDEADNVQFPHGLSVGEICAVITRTGAVPLVVRPRLAGDPSAQMRHVLHTFVESDLPVVLCCEKPGRAGHAVVTVGHALPPPTWKEWDAHCQPIQHVYAKASREQFLASQAVTRYYVHDDAYGPYNRLDFQPPDKVSDAIKLEYKKYRKDLFCPVVLAREGDEVWNLWAMVVPMPPYVKNRPDTIMPDASVRFARLFAMPIFQVTVHGLVAE